MGFLAGELIASCHAVPSLSDRVKAADFDGPHEMNKRPSSHERLSPRRLRQNERNEWGWREGDVEGVCDYVVCASVCAREEEAVGDGVGWEEKDDWDKQSVPLQGRETKQEAVACGYTAKCAEVFIFNFINYLFNYFFHMINMSGVWLGGSGAHWNSVILCVITCAMSKYTAQRRERYKVCPAAWETEWFIFISTGIQIAWSPWLQISLYLLKYD